MTSLRVLTGRREELVQAQTARINRLRDLPVSIHPGLERTVDLVLKADLILLTKYVTPAQIRAAEVRRVVTFLTKHGVREKKAQALAEAAHGPATEQRVAVAGEVVMAEMIRGLAGEAIAARNRIRHLDEQLEEALDQHPDAAVTRSLPGMGVVLTPSSTPRSATSIASPTATTWPPLRAWLRRSMRRARLISSPSSPSPDDGSTSSTQCSEVISSTMPGTPLRRDAPCTAACAPPGDRLGPADSCGECDFPVSSARVGVSR